MYKMNTDFNSENGQNNSANVCDFNNTVLSPEIYTNNEIYMSRRSDVETNISATF
jgi:hypothetical protein